jgi:hypothetical protein
VKRTLRDFLRHELVFEHLRTIYRHHLGTGGYDRTEMVEGLASYLESVEGRRRLAEGLFRPDVEILYLLRQVGGIAPARWLFREASSRCGGAPDEWREVFRDLRRRHLTFVIGSDIAYLPEGFSDLLGTRIAGRPRKLVGDVVPGASAQRRSAHGLVVALFNYLHQNPPRVMAEDEKIWKRDLEGLAEFFLGYLAEPGPPDLSSPGAVRGRVSRLVELLRKMGFLEKRGKRLYLDPANWSDWASRPELERHSLFLSFLEDHYENLPVALEALVDWKDAGWIPVHRLTEAVRYRALRSHFHILRVRPQADVPSDGPGPRWVGACVHLLADLGLVWTGCDRRGHPVALATDGGVEAWNLLHDPKRRRRRAEASSPPRAFAQPNFELLIPEECSPGVHRDLGAIAALRSLDRFWTYVLTPGSVARGVEEGLSAQAAAATVERVVEGRVPPSVREAVLSWGATAWWVDANGSGPFLQAERRLLESLVARAGIDEIFEPADGLLRLRVPRADAERWLEERGVRVAGEDVDAPGEFGRSTRGEYARALEAWRRRLDHSGSGTPAGSYWTDVVPVEPFESGRRTHRR